MNARFPRAKVRVEGRSTDYVRISDDCESRTFHFCPDCGGTVYYEAMPGFVAVPVGGFADPSFPPPTFSIYESRQHPWVTLATVEHYD